MSEEKGSASLLMGSEPGFDLVCIPCSSSDKDLEAEGYCMDCYEHLCAQCLSYHRTLTAVKHHKLLDKVSMPMDQKGQLAKDICTEICKIHRENVVKYFCPAHRVLGCSICVTMKHKQCDDVAYIPEIATDLENTEEYKIFRQRLAELINKSHVILNACEEKRNQSAYLYSQVQQDISAFRQEINAALDQLEAELKATCEQINSQNTDTIELISIETNEVLKGLQNISSDYQELLSKKQYCQAYTNLKTIDLTPIQDMLKDIVNINFSYKFRPYGTLLQMLKGKNGLGKLLVWKPGELKPVHMTGINISTSSNAQTCSTRAIALLSKDKLVVTDFMNEAVKLIDLVDNEVSFELHLANCPWSATTVDKNKVAVTLPMARKILFLRCNNSLVIDSEISVIGKCRGIAFYQDKLEILSMTGDVLHSFEKDDQGNKLFINAQYVSVHTEGPSLFVSDWGNYSLIKLSFDGKTQAVYRDDEMKFPGQCVIDKTGLVYLCGEDSHNIHLLTTECTKMKISLDKTNGLRYPCSIYYCEDTCRLGVGMHRNDNIKVFQLNV